MSRLLGVVFVIRTLVWHRLALTRLQSAQRYGEQAAEYQHAIDSAPAETIRLRRLPQVPVQQRVTPMESTTGLESLAKQLTASQTLLSTQRSRWVDLGTEITALQARP